MKILFSILINASILYIITYLLWANEAQWIANGVTLWCWECSYSSPSAWITYVIWWIILWIMNITIRPLLKILSLPFYLIFFSLVGFVVNAVILKLFDYIVNDLLIIPNVWYTINWTLNFIIAVAIFTFLNMFYSLIFSKK
jgi:putative membrane protein